MSNGCGCSSGILRYIKPPYAELFYAACCKHDDAYDNSINRLEADRLLFRDMLYTISKSNYTILRILWLINISLIYYFSVRLFGWKYWKSK